MSPLTQWHKKMQKVVLVVDDDTSVRAYLKAALKREGFLTLEAGDGELGLGADSDDVDQSFRSDADQFGAKRRRALSV